LLSEITLPKSTIATSQVSEANPGCCGQVIGIVVLWVGWRVVLYVGANEVPQAGSPPAEGGIAA
jgi:hypothetical protein